MRNIARPPSAGSRSLRFSSWSSSDCTRVIGLRRGEILFDCAPQDATEARLDQLYAGSNERL